MSPAVALLHTPCTKFIIEENGQVTILTPEGRIFQTTQETIAPLNIRENVSLPVNGYVVEHLLDHLRNNTPLRPCYLSQLWAIGLMMDGCPRDAVTINVGGVLFRISLSLLTSKFDYFASLYGRWNNVESVFVDRSCDSFCSMLNYVCEPDKFSLPTVEKELVFFGYKEEKEAEPSVPTADDFRRLSDKVPEPEPPVPEPEPSVPEPEPPDIEDVWSSLKAKIQDNYVHTQRSRLLQNTRLYCYVVATTGQISVLTDRLQELGYSDIKWSDSNVVSFGYGVPK